MAGSPPNLHTMDSRSACILGVLKVKVKVKVKGHVIREISWILGMSYSVIDGLVLLDTVIIVLCVLMDKEDHAPVYCRNYFLYLCCLLDCLFLYALLLCNRYR